MARSKKTRDDISSDVSDPSCGEASSDDSDRPRKKIAKKETKKPPVKRKPSPKKHKDKDTSHHQAPKGGDAADSSDDEEDNGLAAEYDDDDLVNIVVPPPPVPCMQAEGGPRLIITDIVVDNFKSYYGKRRIGPFHQNFTAIIGPNGSGKSNVIDALLFVFGYKASKIRSKKVSVLIHSSAGKDNIPSCTVKIAFQLIEDDKNGGSYKVIPNSDFTVSRTAYRNNTSEYRMNDVRMTIKEVAKKLREVGIDLVHNRFLILQGEVEQIAMMKPKATNPNEEGMLEYLEDIIGSSRFKVPIEKLTAKLETLQTDKSHQNAKVNAALREKEAMDEPVQQMIRYMENENDTAALKCQVTMHKKYKELDHVAQVEPEYKKMKEELNQVNDELKVILDRQSKKRQEIADAEAKVTKMQNQVKTTEAEINTITQVSMKRANDVKRLLADIAKLKKEQEKEKEKYAEAVQAPNDAQARILVLKKSLEELKDELSTAQTLYDENFPKYTKKTEAEREKKAKLEEEYAEIAASLATAESKCTLAESKLKTAMEDYEKRKAQLDALTEQLDRNKEHLERKLEESKQAHDREAALKEEMRDTRKKLEDIVEKFNAADKEFRTLVSTHEPQAQGANAQSTYDRVSSLFDGANIDGYYGRLGDLGSIDKKYDRAISSTCGYLDNFVVETIDVANQCIDLLKANKFGMWTFIIMRQQEKFKSQVEQLKRIPVPKNTQRLFDLIDCDAKFKNVFFFAVRDALIVDNIDIATEMNNKNKNQKYITLNGEVVSACGVMQGGGQPVEGKMGRTRKDPRQVEAEHREWKKVQARLEEIEPIRDKYEAEIRAGERRVMEIGNASVAAERRMKELDAECKILSERVKTQEHQKAQIESTLDSVKMDEKEKERLNEEIETLKQERDEARKKSAGFKAKIKEIDDMMKIVYNKTVKIHEDSMTRARAAIEENEKDTSKQNAIIKMSTRNIANGLKAVQELEQRLEKKSQKNSSVSSESETSQKRITELNELKTTHQEMLKNLEEELKKMRETTTELDSSEVAAQKKQKQVQEKVDELKAAMKQSKKRITDLDAQIEAYKLHNIDEIMMDIPQEMQSQTTARRFLFDGESDSDLDDFEEFMTGDPAKKKEMKEEKKSRKDMIKKRKMAVHLEEDEEDEEDEERRPASSAGAASSGGAAEGGEEQMEVDENGEPVPKEPKLSKKERAEKEAAMLRAGKMPEYTKEQVRKIDQEYFKARLSDLENEREVLKKNLQPHILEDFKAKVAKLVRESDALKDISKRYSDHREKLERLKKERLADFMAGFECIGRSLTEMYQMITLGGDASLELKDLIDPFLEGVQFMVRPPKKSWKQIENLSGGEKTLSSLALVFALHAYRPTPLYVMDEIDAALDFRNVSIIGHYIKNRTKNAQFIIISLRNNMFELADRLIGIYKVHDCTRNVVVDPKKVMDETKELRDGMQKLQKLMTCTRNQTGV